MENSSPLILEISSDEETDFGCARVGGGVGGEYGDREDCNWLSKLLDEVGGKKDDDSDDVVFVSEVLGKNPKKSRLECFKQLASAADDDDDCVILDGDPDKSIVVFNGKVDNDDSDDLEIVGEKGEVACRDFPHPRHLCAKFPFASTPHQVHCTQCHCHVCDSLAPCSNWGNGLASIDHCHANDKDEYWRSERKLMKKGDKALPNTPSTSGTIRAFFQRSQVRSAAPQQPNYLPQNQVLNPVTIRPCSISTVSVPNTANPGIIQNRVVNSVTIRPCSTVRVPNTANTSIIQNRVLNPVIIRPCSTVGVPNTANPGIIQNQVLNPVTIRPGSVSTASVPNTANPGRINPSGSVPASNNKPRSSLASRQLHPSYKSNNAVSRSAQSLTSHAVFKRPGFVGATQNNRQAFRSHLSRDKNVRPSQTPVLNERHGSNQPSSNWVPTAHSVLPQPDLSSPLSQSHIQSKAFSNPRVEDSVHYQSQPDLSSALPLQPNLASQPSEENFQSLYQPIIRQPSQTVQTYKTDVLCDFHEKLHAGSVFSSHPHVGNNFENQSSQPQAHNNSTSLFIDGHNDFQQANQTQKGIDGSPADFGFASDSSLSHGNLQIQNQSIAPIDNIHQESVAPVDNIHQESVVVADNSLLVKGNDNQFPGSTGPDLLGGFQFDNWMFENHSLPGAFEVPMSPVWNVFSPEPASLDTGTLFDI